MSGGTSENARSREAEDEGCAGQDAGFSTPKLKARVPEPPKKLKVKVIEHVEVPGEKLPEKSAEEKQERRGGAANERSKQKRRNDAINTDNTLDEYMTIKKRSSTQKINKTNTRKRGRSLESDREAGVSSVWSSN